MRLRLTMLGCATIFGGHNAPQITVGWCKAAEVEGRPSDETLAKPLRRLAILLLMDDGAEGLHDGGQSEVSRVDVLCGASAIVRDGRFGDVPRGAYSRLWSCSRHE